MKRKAQKWDIEKIESKIDKRLLNDEQKIISAIFNECVAFAKRAKNGHPYRDWETDRKSTRLNSSHSAKSRMPSSA